MRQKSRPTLNVVFRIFFRIRKKQIIARRDDMPPPIAADLRPCADRSAVRTALLAWPRRWAPSWIRWDRQTGCDWKCETWKYETVKMQVWKMRDMNLRHQLARVGEKCETWICGTRLQGWKMQDMKMRDQIAGVETAGKVSMESQSVKKCLKVVVFVCRVILSV